MKKDNEVDTYKRRRRNTKKRRKKVKTENILIQHFSSR